MLTAGGCDTCYCQHQKYKITNSLFDKAQTHLFFRHLAALQSLVLEHYKGHDRTHGLPHPSSDNCDVVHPFVDEPIGARCVC